MTLHKRLADLLDERGLDRVERRLWWAAYDGDDTLAEAVAALNAAAADDVPADDGETDEPAAFPDRRPVPVWLSGISVEGFRGIGPRAELRLDPGPGLTLVVGRNGPRGEPGFLAVGCAVSSSNRPARKVLTPG